MRSKRATGRARCATSASPWFSPKAQHLVPLLDGITRRWLMRSCSPYLPEIAAIASALESRACGFLNGSYEWGCTSLARDNDAATSGPWLVRTLDWPFPGLGRHAEIARMSGLPGRVLQRDLAGFRRRAHRHGAGDASRRP